MATQLQPITLTPGAGFAPSDSSLIFKVVGTDTGGQYTVIELTTAPGAGSPLHIHQREDEAVYVLEGVLSFYLEDAWFVAEPGAFVFIPRGQLHAFVNRAHAPARSLMTITPAGLEGFFLALAGPNAPHDQASFTALAAEYGLVFLGPPPEERVESEK